MDFQTQLITAKFLKRYKRFFADIEIEGKVQVAHVANTGSLKSVLSEGADCLVSYSDDPERKLKYNLQALQLLQTLGNGNEFKDEHHKRWVGVNTSYPNKLGVEAFDQKLIADWGAYSHIQSEVKINEETRLDLALFTPPEAGAVVSGGGKAKKKTRAPKLSAPIFSTRPLFPIHLVEIKNVTLKVADSAQFPDAVTERGQKHLRELMDLKAKGYSVEILFIVQREDCTYFSPAREIDPDYAKLLEKAAESGVKIRALVASINEKGIALRKEELPVRLR